MDGRILEPLIIYKAAENGRIFKEECIPYNNDLQRKAFLHCSDTAWINDKIYEKYLKGSFIP